MPRDPLGPPRRRHGAATLVALALVAAGCAADENEDAIAACATFQDHLESMREADDRQAGLAYARDAAETAASSGDSELAEAFEDYQRVIVRFALAEDDVEAAQQQIEEAGDAEPPRVEDELADAEERLEDLIEAGDLVLSHINAGCGEHGVVLE